MGIRTLPVVKCQESLERDGVLGRKEVFRLQQTGKRLERQPDITRRRTYVSAEWACHSYISAISPNGSDLK